MDRATFVVPLRVSLFPLGPPRSKVRVSKSIPHREMVSANRVIVVPNHLGADVAEQHELYKHVKRSLSTSVNVQVLCTVPNPYDSNTKRWERVWLSVLRDAIAKDSNISLLGHGSGADACLRLLEEEYIGGGFACFLPTSDEYYAGERHGRAYHWESIRGHVGNGRIGLVTSSWCASRAENEVLAERLSASMVVELNTRCAKEVHALLLSAIWHVCGVRPS